MIRLSGITASGHVHLGNYLGAVRRWATQPGPDDLYFVADLHGMTIPYNPQRLRVLAREQLAVLVAAGVPASQVFVQSDLVREHTAMTWVLECVCTFGEARRMIQFKEKSRGQTSVRVSLLTYPVLMASDILLHGAGEVPVGADQSQHVELARALARRFNDRYGEVFVTPKAVLPPSAARIRDLSDPTRKMTKSAQNSAGVIFALDPPDLVRRKVFRAMTDTLDTVRYAPESQPGVSNLLEILAGCGGSSPADLADQISGYAELKDAVTDAVVETLRPVRERAKDLLGDSAELDRVRATGAERARERAEPRLSAALRLAGIG